MLYINVPYPQREWAKELGARWDPSRKSWYVESTSDYYKFGYWIIGEEAEEVAIVQDYIYLVLAPRTCWLLQK